MVRLLALVLALGSSDAPRITVRWTGPEPCPRARFEDGLATHLARSEAPAVEIDAEVTEDAGRWRLVATLSSDDRSYSPRSFVGHSCEAVVDAAALATAIAIDPLHAGESVTVPEPVLAPPPPRGPEAPPVAIVPRVAEPIATVRVARPIPPPAPRSRGRGRGFVAAAASIDGGALPGIGAGVQGAAGWLGRRVRLELAARWRAPVRVHAVEDRRVGARIDLIEAGARVCGRIVPNRALELPVCAGLDAGLLRGRGFGLARDRTARLPWVAAVAGVGLVWSPWDRLAVFVRSEVGLPVWRHAFVVAGLATLDRVVPVFGRAFAGVEVRFP